MKLAVLLATAVATTAWSIDADTYMKRGQAAAKAGEYEKATDAYEAALRLKGEDATLRHELAGVYGKQGKMERALAEAKKAAELAPKQARYQVTLAALYLAQETPDLDEAEAHLRKAVKIMKKERDHPGLASAYFNLGVVAQRRRALEKACRYYRLAFEHNPADEKIRAALAALDPAALRE